MVNLATDFPTQFYINLGRDAARRAEIEARFYLSGLTPRRHPAIAGKWLKSHHGYLNRDRRAKAMTKRTVLRRAALGGAAAVLIFEDDVSFHPEIHERLATITLPEDWGIFFLGCFHIETPEVVAPNLVRVNRAVDNHAWVVRKEYFNKIRKSLRGQRDLDSGTLPFSDVIISRLLQEIPAYAVYPNLVWQDPVLGGTKNYDAEGNQINQGMSRAMVEFADTMGAWCRQRGLSHWDGPTENQEEPPPILPGPVNGRRLYFGSHENAAIAGGEWENLEAESLLAALPLPFSEGSVRALRVGWGFEALTLAQAFQFFKEVLRILEHGGKLSILLGAGGEQIREGELLWSENLMRSLLEAQGFELMRSRRPKVKDSELPDEGPDIREVAAKKSKAITMEGELS